VPDEPTCGQGLAHHSALPAKAGELIDGLAATLEAHVATIDTGDDAGRAERDVYVALAERHRRIAAELRAAAEEMARQADLPMAGHDQAALVGPPAVEAFSGFAAAEQELLDLLRDQVDEHRAMLGQMQQAGAG